MKRAFAVLLLLFVFLPPAAACGGGFLMAMLFRVYPEAEQVALAEDRARNDGFFEGPAVPASDAAALHEWRAMQVDATAARLQTRLREIDPDMPKGKSVCILLIHELQWLEISTGDDGTVIAKRPHCREGNLVRLFTTHGVLSGLMDGTVGWEEALERKLMTARDAAGERKAWLAALRQVTGTRAALDRRAN